jgi:7-cyano-7-deazaguanine synthase
MNPSHSKKAVVLLSGGLDSATVAAIAKAQGYTVAALSVDYGQRQRVELEMAKRQAMKQGIADHRIVSVDLRALGGSALTSDIDVPTGRSEQAMAAEIPVTYVPARNTVLLALALGFAEVIGAFDLFVGVNAVDYSGYPDCRPEFIKQFEQLANLATKAGATGAGAFTIHAPLLFLTKAQIIREGTRLGVDYSLTISCYQPDAAGRACGRCDSCLIRKKGFAEAGLADPTRYQN